MEEGFSPSPSLHSALTLTPKKGLSEAKQGTHSYVGWKVQTKSKPFFGVWCAFFTIVLLD